MARERDGENVDRLLGSLERAIKSGNPNTALVVVLELENVKTERGQVPDDLLERMFELLQTKDALESAATSTVLQFFAFNHLTKAQRRRCMEVLKAISSKLVGSDACWVAAEVYDRLLIARD